MERKDYIFWVALPPAADDLSMFSESAGLAEPLIDLRYGSKEYKTDIVKKALQAGIEGLTLFIDYNDKELTAIALKARCRNLRVILSSIRRFDNGLERAVNQFKHQDIIAGIEVDNREYAFQAQALGADFIVASGNEAYGPVSKKTGFILAQELLKGFDIPLVIRGSLGPKAAAGVLAAGCAGCILDSQLLLLKDCPVSTETKRLLSEVSPCDTVAAGELVNNPYRFICTGRRDKYIDLLNKEKEIFSQNLSAEDSAELFRESLKPLMLAGFSREAIDLPTGQGIIFSQHFAKKGLGIRDVIKVYNSALTNSIAAVKENFPFSSKSPLAQFHKTDYPLVQGPMARITTHPDFAKETAKAGALPFVALAGLTTEERRCLLKDARSLLGERPFGAGIAGFCSEEELEEQVKDLLDTPADFATIAGGNSKVAKRLEKAGIRTYVHAPTPAHIESLLADNITGIILEGHEAGGHIGALGSLILWELAVRELLKRNKDGSTAIRILFAGGIATARGSLITAVLASPLLRENILMGLQLGTVYLLADEAAECGAVSREYRDRLLKGDETVITGRTVNLPARWLLNNAAREMLNAEFRLEAEGLPLSERKREIEASNICNLSKALPDKAGHRFSQADNAYMCGEAIAFHNEAYRIAGLHEELIVTAQGLAESCPAPEMPYEVLDDAVAIIGIGCIFPGADNPDEYWDNIINKRCFVRELSRERCDLEEHFDPERGRMHKSYSKLGAFIDNFKKDPLKFHIPPVSAPFIARAQFLILEAAYQALGDSGYLKREYPRQRTAVFVGSNGKSEMGTLHHVRAHWKKFCRSLNSSEEFKNLPQALRDAILAQSEEVFNRGMPGLSEDSCGGVFGSILASRINNCFNLGGTSLVLDAACASSLAAVNIAVKGLRERDFDMALAGAVDGYLNVGSYLLFSSLGAISAKGSFPFDERADGLVLGEGAGVIILKRLDDAVRDGDKVYAVIRNISSSSDGRAKGITAPDVEGQIRSLERTYRKTPFAPDTVSFIEAHGTGTWAGDKAEIASLNQFFRRYSDRKRFIGLGSVKSMIGHLKSAAGMAGIIKIALAFDRQVLPPMIGCRTPRKDFDWQNCPFYLLNEAAPWKSALSPKRAAINAFGFGGINYHAVLEEPPPKYKLFSGGSEKSVELPAHIFLFRAPDRGGLIRLLTDARDSIALREESDLCKIAAEILRSSSRQGPIVTIVAADKKDFLNYLDKAVSMLKDKSRKEFFLAQGIYFSEVPLNPGEKVAFLFPGLGPQYPGMGGDLPLHFPLIGEMFRKVDSISRRHNGISVLPLLDSADRDSLRMSRSEESLMRSDYNHPAIMALETALFTALLKSNVSPDMVCGHSLGEYCALYAAGVFDLETLINITTVRGDRLAEYSSGSGSMASIALPAESLEGIIKETTGFLTVANKNCPAQTVVSGDANAVEDIIARMQKANISCKRLPVAGAYHTKLLKPCSKSFREFLDTLDVNPPKIPVQSNLTGSAYKPEEDFAPRLRDALAEHLIKPVEFAKNVVSMYDNGARLFIEVGPGSTLGSFVDNILMDKPHLSVSTNLAQRPAATQLIHALAFCAAKGLPVDLSRIIACAKRQALSRTMPAYPLSVKRYPRPKDAEPSKESGLIDKYLTGQDKGLVKRYLAERENFIRDMLCLDFKHFKQKKETASDSCMQKIDRLKERILGLISRKTGYPADYIDIDFDVEAELGLDSIKQVEIIREVSREFNIDFGEDPKSQRYKITTPRKLIEACRKLIGKEPVLKERKAAAGISKAQAQKTGWHTDCCRWVCDKREAPLTGRTDLHALKDRRILVLAQKDVSGGLIKDRLESAGAKVFMLSDYDSPDVLSSDFDIVLDMWSYGEDDRVMIKDIDLWWSETEKRARAILKLGKLLSSSMRDKDGKTLWAEITSLGGDLGAGFINAVPAKAGIGTGLVRCLACEFPDKLQALYLDFSSGQPLKRVAECIFSELSRRSKHSEIGYVNGKRFEIYWKREEKKSGERRIKLNSKSVVLAIGGARGVTASICKELAGCSKARFIVVGKSPVDMQDNNDPAKTVSFDEARGIILEEARRKDRAVTPAETDRLAWERVWRIERLDNMGSLKKTATEAVYYQCDITDAEAVKGLIGEIKGRYGRIDLVIQGASGLLDRSIEDMDADRFIQEMRHKALGTAAVLAALSGVNADTFINFSSIAGRWGNIGQASYAAGHEIAAVLTAGMRKKFPGRWINIFFGPWLKIGMIRLGDVIERLHARGSNFITAKAGNEFFINEFTGGINGNVAFCGRESLKSSYCPDSDKPGETKPPAGLIETIEVIEPGLAAGSRTFDLKRDRIVAEHYVDYEKPIMPGVVSLEMIAQTASALSPAGFSVTRITDIAFPHPGIFPREEPRKFYTRVKMLSNDKKGIWFEGNMYSIFIAPGSGKRQEMCHAACKVHFGRLCRPAKKPSLLYVSTGLGACSIDAAPLWKTEARSGRKGMFRTISSVSSVTRSGVEGEVCAPKTEAFGKSPVTHNPMLTDGLLDLINLSTDLFQGSESSLVGRIKSIEFFAGPTDSRKRFCRTRIRSITKKGIMYDAEAIDSNGGVTQRVRGVEKLNGCNGIVRLSEPIWESLRENPRQKEIKRLLGCDCKLIFMQVPISLVEEALKADKNRLLSEELTEQEKEQYTRFKHKKRRLEWLSGRIVSKAAVRMYSGKDILLPVNITVQNFSDNSPYAADNSGRAVTLPYISISHSCNIAAAAAAAVPGIGIDVEKINRSISEIAEDFCADSELELVISATAFSRETALTVIWAVKEACCKATRLKACMKQLAINKAEACGDYITCELYDNAAGGMRSAAFHSGGYAYAVSITG